MKKASLTIKFMGLCALVQDNKDDTKVREVTVLMPATEKLVSSLCKHDPVLLFKHSDLPVPQDRETPPHQSLADFDGKTYGLWNLAGLQLSIETPPAAKAFKLKTDYDRLLDFVALHPALGPVDPSFLDPLQWNDRILSSFKFDSGTFEGATLGGKDVRGYGLAPVSGNPTTEKRFRQAASYQFFGATNNVVTLVGRPVAGGEEQRLRLRASAEVTVTHLCPADKPDARPTVEEDVLAFYELSTVVVPEEERRVLHRLPKEKGGIEATPRQDSCPPVRAYIKAA